MQPLLKHLTSFCAIIDQNYDRDVKPVTAVMDCLYEKVMRKKLYGTYITINLISNLYVIADMFLQRQFLTDYEFLQTIFYAISYAICFAISHAISHAIFHLIIFIYALFDQT